MDSTMSHNYFSGKALQGNSFEQQFVAMLNQDRQNPIWSGLGIIDPQVFLVNVSSNQVSKLTGKKVKTKSDCYAIKIHQDIGSLLVAEQYLLTEELLARQQIPFSIIHQSGISIKMPDSTHYTLQKLSYQTFCRIFTTLSPAYFVAALLFIDPAQINKNNAILATFAMTITQLCQDLNVQQCATDLATFIALKNHALATIKQQVNTNQQIYNTICYGDGIFDDPYTATFIFENGQLLKRTEYHTDIIVTTGSGRSKGIYTLVFK